MADHMSSEHLIGCVGMRMGDQFLPTKKLANHYSSWMDQERVTDVTLRKVEVSENQFGKYTEKLSEISEEADASVEVWVRLRSNKKNDPYRH
jgi:hypothetical protein